MRTLASALLLLAPAAAMAAGPDDPVDKAADVGAPIVAGNLVVFPLLAKAAPAEEPDVLTLDEALDKKVLRIHETDESGTVNTLHVTSASDHAVFAMAGEVLLGGKQDRIVGRNVLIPPHAKEMAVAVFCVEHGRWTPETATFASGKTLAHTSLRQQANKEDQGQVWAEVAKTNAKLKTSNATDTYRATAKKVASSQDVARAVAAVEERTKGQAAMAGVLVAVGGKVRAIDWFGSPKLYRRLEHKLLASYATEALGAEATGAAAPTVEQARQFLVEAARVDVKATEDAGDGTAEKLDSPVMEGEALRTKAGKKPVIRSYYTK